MAAAMAEAGAAAAPAPRAAAARAARRRARGRRSRPRAAAAAGESAAAAGAEGEGGGEKRRARGGPSVKGKVWTDSCYDDPYFAQTGRVRGKRFGRRAAMSVLYEALTARRHPMDVFEARRGAIDRMGAPIEVVPLPAFFAATGVDDAPPLAVAPTPALERAVEARAGGAVEEDSAKAQRVARESALDERTFAEPLYSTMSEGAVSYAQKLLAAATRCSVEHGEVLRCCLPVDPLERARFRVMELAILRVALSELELRAPASVVIYEAEMCTKDYCEAGMHVPVRRVLTTYLSETTRGGENGWGAAKPEAPWDYHPEMLLNPKKTQAKAVGAGPKRSASKEADAEPAGLTPRALEAEGGVAPAPSSSGTSNVVTGTDAASAELDALLGEQVRGAEEAADAVARRAEEGIAAVSSAESEVEEDGPIAGGEDMSVDSEDDNEELWDELADEMLDDAEDDQGDAPEAAQISAVEQRNRARVENVMSKFAEKQAAAAGKQRPRDGPKQSRRTGESGGAAADDDDDSDILDEIDLLTEGYNVRETKPQGFGL